jgi:hypothetical protein
MQSKWYQPSDRFAHSPVSERELLNGPSVADAAKRGSNAPRLRISPAIREAAHFDISTTLTTRQPPTA